MTEIKAGAVIKARNQVVSKEMRTLIAAGEVVRCVEVSAPVVGDSFTIRVEHFGKTEKTTIRLKKENFKNFEVI